MYIRKGVDLRHGPAYVNVMTGPATNTASQQRIPDGLPPLSPFSQLFDEFAEHQMADVSVREIVSTTAGVVVACAFLMGGCYQLARQQRVNRKEAHQAVVRCLMSRLAMASFNAEGLISANKRLAGKYQLIANMQQQGAEAGDAWLADRQTVSVMSSLVEKGRLMSLSDLDAEGIREVEASLGGRVRDVGRVVADSWIGKLLFWVVLFAVIAALNFWFFSHSDLLLHVEQALEALVGK